MLDEFYWLNKDDPNYSLQRVTERQGEDAHTDFKFNLNSKAQKDIMKVFLTSRSELENKRINEVFGKGFLASNFWLYWRTMFAFEEWHSALEIKQYLHRFIHHIKGLPDLSTLQVHQIQPVRVSRAVAVHVAARSGSEFSVRYRSHRHRLRYHG
ncbi:oleate hydratase [Rhodococcus qingshengii]|uniref:oleate hydratase n=1 Tax=Rhodococcus qingshengii TaxID=334542 RepID=UPI003B984693